MIIGEQISSYMTFVRRLAELRQAANLSQADLAERAGISQQCISRLEGGTQLQRVQKWSQLERIRLPQWRQALTSSVRQQPQ